MADNGICCIDEFDKIDEQDVSAIHEAMEQQTISITKAGIQATLNSRTAILAALNPRYGRYDKSKSLRMNINMAPPLMSRFDMIFVVTDDCDEVRDFGIAKHILSNHKRYAADYIEFGETIREIDRDYTANDNIFSIDNVIKYLRHARLMEPKISPEAAEDLLRYYIEIREYASMNFGNSYNITVRQLESMIRLSEAIARIHMTGVVTVVHAKEAARLLRNSILQTKSEDYAMEDEHGLKNDLEGLKIQEEMPEENQNAIKEEQIESVSKNKLKKVPTKKVSLTNEKFEDISKKITEFLERYPNGVKSSVLLDRILMIERESVSSMKDIKKWKSIIKAVIKHMIHKSNMIIQLSSVEDKDPLLALHSSM